MDDNNIIREKDEAIEETVSEYSECQLSEEEACCGEYENEGSTSLIAGYIDSYCDNLINPDPEKCISPKALYITLGASALGAVLLFLFLGWLLCYCPVRDSGYSAEDFIYEYNAIVSEADVYDVIEKDIARLNVSPSDANILYPDFTDLAIPEDADLEEGVLLCGGDIMLRADLHRGNIQYLEVAVTEDCEIYDFDHHGFGINPDADADYSKFQHYAAIGKARLALNSLVCKAEGTEVGKRDLNVAVNYGVIMENYAYYIYNFTGSFDPSAVYGEEYDTFFTSFDPSCFRFYADTYQKTIIPTDNGIYRFFDGIFGEKPEVVEEEEHDHSHEESVLDSFVPSDNASASDVSSADAVSPADAQ